MAGEAEAAAATAAAMVIEEKGAFKMDVVGGIEIATEGLSDEELTPLPEETCRGVGRGSGC